MADKWENRDQGPRRERFGHANERFLGHKFLQNVTYNGEPVVPLILFEDSNNEDGPHFYVENVGGVRLDNYLNDRGIPVVDRLKTLSHVLGQLQAIDAAGYVLFDRVGRNIIIAGKGDRVSVRQVDLEDIYDSKNDAVYSDHRRDVYEKYVKMQQDLGQSPWAGDIGYLAVTVRLAINEADLKHVDLEEYSQLRGYFHHEKNPLAIDPLGGFKKKVDGIIEKYANPV